MNDFHSFRWRHFYVQVWLDRRLVSIFEVFSEIVNSLTVRLTVKHLLNSFQTSWMQWNEAKGINQSALNVWELVEEGNVEPLRLTSNVKTAAPYAN